MSTINLKLVSAGLAGDVGSSGASGDGRYVTFYSNAPDLVRNDTNDDYDVFVADMQLGGIRRIYEHGATHDISADGRYVLVGSSPNGGDPDLKRINVQTGAAEVVTSAPAKGLLSADGRYVAFSTYAALAAADTNNDEDVYVKDMVTGIVRLVSTTSSGALGNGGSSLDAISPDGSRVAFHTSAANFGGSGSAPLLIIKDIPSGAATALPGTGFAAVGFAAHDVS